VCLLSAWGSLHTTGVDPLHLMVPPIRIGGKLLKRRMSLTAFHSRRRGLGLSEKAQKAKGGKCVTREPDSFSSLKRYLCRALTLALSGLLIFMSGVDERRAIANRCENSTNLFRWRGDSFATLDNMISEQELLTLYLSSVERHVSYAESLWHDYSAVLPHTGYFGDGTSGNTANRITYFGDGTSIVYGIRTAADYAYMYAFLYITSQQAKFSGSPKSFIKEHAIETIRYLANTHKSVGEANCADGQQWGLVWESALWSTRFGMAAWMLWDELDADIQSKVQTVIVNEADLIASREPPFAEYINTYAEENGWDSNIVSLAASMFPDNPKSLTWDFKAREYMMNTLSVAYDLSDTTVVAGWTVSEWVHGANLHPDYTVENHGIFHPVYNMVTLNELGNSAVSYAYGGKDVPITIEHHVLDVWGNVLKAIVLADGEWAYPNGLDWMIHDYEHLPAFAWLATYFKDPAAAMLERRLAQYMTTRQSLQDDGSFFGRLNDIAELRESVQAARVVDSYLYHQFWGPSPDKVVSWEELEQTQLGTHLFEYCGIALHRTAAKVATFSWLNRIMGLVIPQSKSYLNAPYVTLPYEKSFVGSREVIGVSPDMSLITYTVQLDNNWFATTGSLAENESTITHHLSFVSFPGHSVVYMEQLLAASTIQITVEHGIPLGIEMDAMSGLTRTIYAENNMFVSDGTEIITVPGEWTNLDDRLGMIVKGGHGIAFGENVPRYGAEQRLLVGSYSTIPTSYIAGQVIADRSALILSDVDHGTTAALADKFSPVDLGEGWKGVMVSDLDDLWLVVSNFFGTAPISGTLSSPRGEPVLEGQNSISELGTVVYLSLETGSTAVLPIDGYVRSEADVLAEWDGNDRQFSLINPNLEPTAAEVSFISAGQWVTGTCTLWPGKEYSVDLIDGEVVFSTEWYIYLPTVVKATYQE